MQVMLPNNKAILSTIQGTLNILLVLSQKAKQALVLLNLKNVFLISLGQLYDNNFKISLDKKDMKVYKDEKLIIRGYRNPSNRL